MSDDFRIRFLLRCWRPFTLAPVRSFPYGDQEAALAAFEHALGTLNFEWTVQLREFDGPVVRDPATGAPCEREGVPRWA